MSTWDDAKRLVALQEYGNENTDSLELADLGLQFALEEVAAQTRLITQEAEKDITLTGVNTYEISTLIHAETLRIVGMRTDFGDVDVVTKPRFMRLQPNYEDYASGVPTHAVLWGPNTLYVWPDQADISAEILYYKVLTADRAGEIMWALVKVAREYLDKNAETRIANARMAQQAIADVGKGQTRREDSAVQFIPERRVTEVNRFKRNRRC